MASGVYKAGYRAGYRGQGYVSGYPGVASPSPPSPPTAGLKLWLKADAGVTTSGGIVTGWADQSGTGNDASIYGGFAGPRLDTNVVNGLPGLSCFYGGTTKMGNAATNLVTPGSARYVVSILRMAPASAGSSPNGFSYGGGFNTFGSTTTWMTRLGQYAGSSYYVNGITTETNVPLANDTAYVYELGSDGTTLTGFINGTALAIAGTTPEVDSGPGWSLFNDLYLSCPFWGWVCEILVWDHVLTGTDLTQVRAYANYRYAI